MKKQAHIIRIIYRELFHAFGPQYWWPAESPFEVIVGAILTQNTTWTNVEKAIRNLKSNKLLSAKALKDVEVIRLAGLIKTAGYYNQKAKKLKNFIQFLFDNYQGSIKKMFQQDLLTLRIQLLQVNGIGPETADSILLYAGEKPAFVVDAYTRRVLSRHELIKEDASYYEIQKYFMDNLKPDVKIFNEYHALLVRLAKQTCMTKANCNDCPLRNINRKKTVTHTE